MLVSCLGLGPTATHAAVDLDLSYIDPLAPSTLRFLAWVDLAVANPTNPPYAFSATDAAYAWRITNNPDYAQLAVDLVEAQVVEAEAEIGLGLRAPIAYDSYLHIGPMLRDLALTYSWCATFVDDNSQAPRWAAYAEQALYNVWNHQTASWGGVPHSWSGWSVDNPGNNYHYSFLQATMYWGLARHEPPGSPSPWISFLGPKLTTLTNYYADLPGGGSREGTGYGVAQVRLFELYRLWHDATGENIGAASSHLADSLDYWLHATVPTFDQFAPIGDLSRESFPNLYDYHRALVLSARAAAASQPGATAARDRASWWLEHISIDAMTAGFNFRDDLLPVGETAQQPAALHHHATGVGHLFARSSWSTDALWLAIVAGPYLESHAHQNQGSFSLFRHEFLAVTENVFTHSGIQQGTEVHNVLRFVDGDGDVVPQREGEVATMTVTPTTDGLHVDTTMSELYTTGEVASWHRTFDSDATSLLVHDTYTVAPGVTAHFQVNTPAQPLVVGNLIYAGDLIIEPLIPPNPTINILDWTTLGATEFREGWKVTLSGGVGEYRVRLIGGFQLFADGLESGNVDDWSARTP